MARTAFTLRIASDERIALENLSKIEGRPMNQILNEAIKNYLGRQSAKEQSLQRVLDNLRAYRERDPNFKEAINALVEAEVKLKDPLEGSIYEETLKPVGPVQSKLRELLNA